MARKIVKRKKTGASTSVLAKQRRQKRWRDTIVFLHRNTAIATEKYMNFEKFHWEKFKTTLSGHESSLKDLALIINRAKIEALPPKPAPKTLKEFKDQQPKKLTKKQKKLEAKNGPSLKPLPKPTLETALIENEDTVNIEKYLDIINRLYTISNIANDFNKQLVKFSDECQPVQNGIDGISANSTVGDLANNGEKMIAYWRGLSGNRTFKVFEQGSVDWSLPALLTIEEENELVKEKWKHLARTVLRLAQNFVQYATQKTGIIINR